MTGTVVVNNLAGLMILTSLLVIGARRHGACCWLYAGQSLVLVAIFVTLSCLLDARSLRIWALSALVTKVILVPAIMGYAFCKLAPDRADPGLMGPVMLIICAAAIVLLCAWVVRPVALPMLSGLKPALTVALGHFPLGLLCIVSQRNILRQIFGYCLMENGSHLVLALLAWRAPELVGVGIATDAVFAVVIMALLVRKIRVTVGSLDAERLTALKG